MTRWDPQGKTQAMSQPTDVLESVGPFVRDFGRTFLLVVVEQSRQKNRAPDNPAPVSFSQLLYTFRGQIGVGRNKIKAEYDIFHE